MALSWQPQGQLHGVDDQARTTAQQALDEVTAYQQQTPTLEELLFTTYIPSYNYLGALYPSVPGTGGGASITVMVAPMVMRVLSLSLSWEYWSIGASDTNYWNVDLLRRFADGSANNIVVTRTTQITGPQANGAIDSRSAWTFAGADTSTEPFNTGDLLGITVRPTGTPADMYLGFTVTIRYAAA